MTRIVLIVLGSVALVALSACAHQELTAPCRFSGIGFGSAFASDCGEARPVNR